MKEKQLSAPELSSPVCIDTGVCTKLLKIDVADNGVLKHCIFQLGFLEGGAW